MMNNLNTNNTISALLLGALSVSCSVQKSKDGSTTTVQEPSLIEKIYLETFGAAPDPIDRTAKQPNFLYITSDQHVWMSVGYNDPDIHTPNLDRLAERGVIFDRAYTVNPVSTPSRATMITGLYPSEHGAYALGTKLPEDVSTIGNYLGDAGYSTAIVGKAHFSPLAGNAEFPSLETYPILQRLDFWRQFTGPFYGFDYACLARNHGDESHVGQHYAIWMEEKLRSEGKDPNTWKSWFIDPSSIKFMEITNKMQSIFDEYGAKGKKQNGVWNIPEEYHLNAFIADMSVRKLDEFAKSGKPFFLWSSFFDPHPPYLVPEPWASMYDPEKMTLPKVPKGDMDDMPYHYRMTQEKKSNWGKQFEEDGQVVHGFSTHKTTPKVHRRNKALYYGMVSMMDKYIGVILDRLEEHGMLENTMIIYSTDHGHHIATHNLEKKGGFAFEEDLRIPFVVSWKGRYPEGKRTNSLISMVDFAPTFLQLAGYKSTAMMSGVNLDPLFKGDVEKAREWVIAENHFQRTKFYQKSYIEDRYKITWYANSDEGELFDLHNDPHEYTNLWDKPEFAELKMKMLLKAAQAEMKRERCHMPRLSPA